MAQALTEENLQKAFDDAIENMPKNVILKYAPIVDKAVQKGLKFDQISEILAKNFNIELKPSAIKKSYYQAFPEKKKTKGKADNKDTATPRPANTAPNFQARSANSAQH